MEATDIHYVIVRAMLTNIGKELPSSSGGAVRGVVSA